MSDATGLHPELLLAAFAEPARALPAWQHWQSRSGWESALDFDAYLLLSRVFHNLGGRGVDDALFRRLKGVVKRNWAANTRRLATMAQVISALQASGATPVLLPPAAELLADHSTPVEDGAPLAMLVEREQVPPAVTHLLAAGWRPAGCRVPRWSLPGYVAGSGHVLLRDANGTTLALHRFDTAGIDATLEWHSHKGQRIACTGPTESVRFLLDAPGPDTEFRRMARALLVLARSADPDGWHYLLRHLRQQGSPLGEVIASLAPPGLPSARPASPPTMANANTMAPADESGEPSPTARLLRLWRRYRAALGGNVDTPQALRYLPGYLMGKWQLRHARELPLRLWRSLRYHWRHDHDRMIAARRTSNPVPPGLGDER